MNLEQRNIEKTVYGILEKNHIITKSSPVKGFSFILFINLSDQGTHKLHMLMQNEISCFMEIQWKSY